MRKDIQAINEAFSKVHKEQSDNTDMEAAPTSPKISEDKKHDDIFYRTWENIVDRMSDDVLESTMYMIKQFDALNDLIKEEYEYRNLLAMA
jgi:hypothetical protein